MPKTVGELYGQGETGTLLDPRYGTEKVYAWFQKRHQNIRSPIGADGVYRYEEHEWKVPLGVRYTLGHPLRWDQMQVQYPWYVTWRSPKNGKRYKKKFMSLPRAIHFVATRTQYVDKASCVIARQGVDILPQLRGKIPRPWYWCPGCMTARKFYIVEPQQYFTVLKKVPLSTGRIDWRERKLRLIRCRFCGTTNRDGKFRRSNQKWETRRIGRRRR
jgi:hypothetical protein